MILLDTHIWIWRTQNDPQLSASHKKMLDDHETHGLGVSIISCWEVAKLVELRRIALPRPVEEWIAIALQYPGTRLIELTPRIAVESTQLPGSFHRDPADQIIVATARVLDIPLLTLDQKIRDYPHVTLSN